MPENIVILGDELAEVARLNGVSKEKAEEYQKGATLGYAKNRVYSQIENSGGSRLVIKSKDGFEGYISKKTTNKMLSAIEKYEDSDIMPMQHYAAVADIVYLYKNSTKVLTHTDKKGSDNVKAIDRFVAPFYGDKVAYITGKQLVKNGRKIYSLELMKLGKLEEKLTVLKSASATSDPN